MLPRGEVGDQAVDLDDLRGVIGGVWPEPRALYVPASKAQSPS